MPDDLSVWELICLGTEPIDLLEVMGITVEEWRAIVGTHVWGIVGRFIVCKQCCCLATSRKAKLACRGPAKLDLRGVV